ncbi:MAG: 2-hydroxymuconate tautomerase [Phycisphaerae bacterium]|nr:2-hydroxymuconate tautomerase [Phycisphaerae bacterium]
MPLVRISMWPGRTTEQKANLATAVTETVVKAIGAPPEAVHVMIEELPKENWAHAGKLHAELFPD